MKVLLLTASLMLAAITPADAARVASKNHVTLTVKDAEATDVIRSLQKQCGVKNVVIDKDVSGRASFFFTDVPCSTAWPVVLRTYGLAATSWSHSQRVVHVESRR